MPASSIFLRQSVIAVALTVACGAPAPPTTDGPPGSSPTHASPAAAAPAPPASGTAAASSGASTVPLPAGVHHHPIQTASPDAQAWFDQGMTLVFAFNHEEAVRAFERAATLDRSAAMPHWGIAWALGPNYNLDIDDPRSQQAHAAMQRAQQLAGNASENERAYIAAFAGRYSPDPKADRAALARAHVSAMRDLTRRYPDDLDAATLYAESLMNLRPWKLWTLTGAPAEGTPELVAVLESVLRREPEHVGANHYYIHAVEASRNPAVALASARRLESLVPAAGHLVHMPAHIYARTGDHAAAARANQAGADADRAYFATAPRGTFYDMAYASHNLHFLVDSHAMQGRLADARQTAAALTAALTPHIDMMPMVESMITSEVSVLLRFGRHDDVLALPAPDRQRTVLTSWHHFARGVALARTGRVEEATKERQALSDAIGRVPDGALFGGTGLAPATQILMLATTVLDARIADARGQASESIRLWRQAVTAGDQVPYDEPPIWFYPLRESLGAAQLRSGDAAAAEGTFRDDLGRNPRNPRSLFGLREALARQKRDATWVQRAFDAAWKAADTALAIEGL